MCVPANVRAKSLSEYVKRHPERHLRGLRLSMKPHTRQGWMDNIPLYAALPHLLTL